MIKKVWNVIISNLFLVIRKFLGCRIYFKPISLVSPDVTFKTRGRGKIYLDKKIGIKPGTEIAATNAKICIGENCFINRNCMIISHESIVLKNNVTIGPGTYIYDHDHDGHGGFVTDKVVIEENVWIGAGCIILKGVTIGEGSIIAAGTLISKNVKPHTMIYQKRNDSVREIN